MNTSHSSTSIRRGWKTSTWSLLALSACGMFAASAGCSSGTDGFDPIDRFSQALASCSALGPASTRDALAGKEVGIERWVVHTSGPTTCVIGAGAAGEPQVVVWDEQEVGLASGSQYASVTTPTADATWTSLRKPNGETLIHKTGAAELVHGDIYLSLRLDLYDGLYSESACWSQAWAVAGALLGAIESCTGVKNIVSTLSLAHKIFSLYGNGEDAFMSAVRAELISYLSNMAGWSVGCVTAAVDSLVSLAALDKCISSPDQDNPLACKYAQQMWCPYGGIVCCDNSYQCTCSQEWAGCGSKRNCGPAPTQPKQCTISGDDEPREDDTFYCSGGDDDDDYHCASCKCTNGDHTWEGDVCGSSTQELVDQCWSKC